MRRLCTLALAFVAATALVRAESNDEVAAHRAATDVAAAFTNGGFKLRDGHWNGKLQAGKSQVIQVNLYAGNQYWFTVGATTAGKKLAVTIYDEAGKPLASEPYSDENKAAAGFSPEVSGPYFVKVEEKEGGPATFCMVYSYK